MKVDVDVSPQPLAVEYLRLIESLTTEIRTGMDAIGQDALDSFEQSVSRQQELCSRLRRAACEMGIVEQVTKQKVGSGVPVHGVDAKLFPHIRVAFDSLKAVNRQYAALLRHAGNSVSVLAALYRSFAGEYKSSEQLGASRTTWSCEF